LVKGINAADGRCGSFHDGGCNILLFDGVVRFIPSDFAPAMLRALGSVASGQRIEW
jgi:prepilin-type processing-associated H-X9-DG protein